MNSKNPFEVWTKYYDSVLNILGAVYSNANYYNANSSFSPLCNRAGIRGVELELAERAECLGREKFTLVDGVVYHIGSHWNEEQVTIKGFLSACIIDGLVNLDTNGVYQLTKEGGNLMHELAEQELSAEVRQELLRK
ncbi:MAG: hypothetical protein WC533_01625 [Candidatus Pacearchaeota archaeon]